MTLGFRPAASAALLVACLASPALASPAVLYTDATVREGPGEQYSPLYQLLAGTHVDLRECTTDEWCRVIRRDKEGWLKFKALDIRPGVADPDEETANSGGTNGGSKKGGSRKGPTDDSTPQFAKVEDDNPRLGDGGKKGRFSGTEGANYPGLGDGTPGGEQASTKAALAGDGFGGSGGTPGPSGPTFTSTTSYPSLGGGSGGDGGSAAATASGCMRCSH